MRTFIISIFFIMTLTSNAQHIIPESIKKEANLALNFYPELKDTHITFKFKKKIKKSTMQAQPTFWSLFKGRKKRSYKILISETVKIVDTVYMTKDIPPIVLTGWLGHELGHIMDYENRSNLNLVGFGIQYVCSGNYIKEAERRADSYAVNQGMEQYILATKDFILNNADISPKYKDRIKKFYLSPEEIMALVEERNAKKEEEAASVIHL